MSGARTDELENCDFLKETDGLWFQGIGWIAQYHCYCDMLYSHGVLYWLRDCAMADPLTPSHRLDALNSEIKMLEQCQSPPTPLCPFSDRHPRFSAP